MADSDAQHEIRIAKPVISVPLNRDHVHVVLRYVDLNPVRAGLVDGAL